MIGEHAWSQSQMNAADIYNMLIQFNTPYNILYCTEVNWSC